MSGAWLNHLHHIQASSQSYLVIVAVMLTNPTYEQVCTNQTGHVEAVQNFDPEVTSFENILDIYFKTFDPTDDQGQFFDRGESYQPVIFYHDEHQKKAAEFKKQQLNQQGIFKRTSDYTYQPLSKLLSS